MISILKHLETLTDNVSFLLSETVEELWEDLNPQNIDGSYSARSLIARVHALRPELEKADYVALVGAEIVARQLTYIDYISDSSNLKKIITAAPQQLDDIIEHANTILRPGDLFIIENEKIHPKSFGPRLLSQVFTYSNYRSSHQCINRYRKLGFDGSTCPYCNEVIMRIVRVEDEHTVDEKMLFDIDHFYSKSLYPYLALSFYNHIPSCKSCNQGFKGTKEFTLATHIHPYNRCFDTLYNFQLNHGVLRNEAPNLLGIRKKSIFDDKLLTDLKLESRYRGNLEPARITDLIEILANYSHLLRGGVTNEDERARLKQRLKDFGIIATQQRILKRCYSKLQRDTIAMFDPDNVLQLL
ncbi:hypothetical protein DM813_28255 [Pseudomonas alkylphenolica]|uniref:HNH nuclease domain-containing protein n=1 Tax=Pseudomonas alkylphenolica TaxID=237609 RepID=A0A443ZEW5_9PSED|nr:hypothetical protein [Pseudomonas alkylphenolica]RWU17254.1 hypothetical protein DM813_28255 [Pseudomonas alkylphenolica]